MKNCLIIFFIGLFILPIVGCGGGEKAVDQSSKPKPKSMLKKEVDPMTLVGVGPIKSITLDDQIDEKMVAQGKTVYEAKCTACHKAEKKFIGPAPAGILKRRTPEWIMNMILNPEEMVKEDPVAKKLFLEFNGSPMANQNLTEEEARAVLEYFRTL